MALKQKFPRDEVRRRCDRFMAAVQLQHVTAFQRVGENFVTNARLRGDYQDITSNLRNSVGYVILTNGNEVMKYTVPAGGDGAKRAAQHMADLSGKYSGLGITIIGVAGMDYALDVESRGKDVISSSAETALSDTKTQLYNIRRRLSK